MRIQVGLKTEIIVQITLLLGAALLLAGILLLKYMERELLSQTVSQWSETADVLTGSLAPISHSESRLTEEAQRLLNPMHDSGTLIGWALLDRTGRVLQSAGTSESFRADEQRRGVIRGVPLDRLAYSPLGLLGFSDGEPHVSYLIPFNPRVGMTGGLQLSFSLEAVQKRVLRGYRILLLYVALYGAVFIFFGTVLLNRSVIRPVRLLRESTHRIAQGELGRAVVVEGPREIADLAKDFNVMMEALRMSRAQTGATIRTLEETNHQLRATRDDLLHSERMASVGHLAAGMAHEVGNPLGALIGYLEFLRGELPSGAHEEIAGRALDEAHRIDRLVRELLDYAAPSKGTAESLDPSAAAQEALEMLIHQGALDGSKIIRDLPSLPPVRIDRHRLLQVLVNLLLNARDAAGREGRIRLSGGRSDDLVTLSVEDDGTGIDPEALSHIFDPFFTTKPPGKGRGLGLSVCHRIVAEAGGRIEVHSTPGEGSVFTVLLPKAAAEGEDPA